MWRQIKLLSGIRICNTFGLNEARFGKDQRKKTRIFLLGGTFLLLGLMMIANISGMAYAYLLLGIPHIIPATLFAAASLTILFFTVFRSGGTIFDLRAYEKEIVLPVKPVILVISRFFTMYLFNEAIALLLMLPGMIIYALFIKPAFSFYIITFSGILLLPLFPLTLGAAIGALITAVGSRLKHKTLITTLLSLFATLGILALTMGVSSYEPEIINLGFSQISELLLSQIGSSYPPAIFFSRAVTGNNSGPYLLFALISLAVFFVFLLLVQWKFEEVCSALSAAPARKNYVLTDLSQTSALKALFKKELKRYFSSTIYVVNTSIGYILMAVFAVFILVTGKDGLNQLLQIEGPIQNFIPMVLAALCIISPTTATSISMEGRQWWIMQSIPVSSKTVFDSKILVNLIIALPCYFLSVLLLFFSSSVTGKDYLWIAVLPLLYILFSSVAGITINSRMPVFNWESETEAVKQSGSVIICMLFGSIAVALPLPAILLLPPGCKDMVYLGTSVVIGIITLLLYRINGKMKLSDIN